ncbi:MAG: acyl-homoserine-lactone synthase [Pseudomonadota bacterium]
MRTTIITPATYSVFSADLEAYHKLRHDIFVSLAGLGRSDLYAAAGQETDIWDLPHFNPVHFVVRDDEDVPVGVARMTSANRPTMMEILYSDFLDDEVPRHPHLWEIQRVGIDLTRLTGQMRERVFLELFTQMEAFSLRNGIQQLMLLTFEGIWKKRLTEMRRMGPAGTHLGFPHVALINELDPEGHAARCRALEALNNKILAKGEAA